ncbi:hypothetical protein DVH05_017036 [Phytophthora capsici]|nr:hypothetical protein DVH05_017036 [Phytophthora capsici]
MYGSPQIKSGNWGTGVQLTLESLGFYHKPHSFNDTTSEPSTNTITRLLRQTATDDGSIAVISAHYVVPEDNYCACMTVPEEDLGFEEGCSRIPNAGVIQFEYSDGSCYEMIFDDTEMYAECNYNGIMGDSVSCYNDLSSYASSAESGVSTTENSDGGAMEGSEDSATATAITYLAPAEGDCNCIEVGDDPTVVEDTCADDVTWGQIQVEYSDSTCYTLEFNSRDLYANCEYTNQRSGDSQLCSFDLTEDQPSTTETPATRAPTTTQSPPGVIIAGTQAPDRQGSDSQAKASSAQATKFSAGRLLAATIAALLLLH